MEKNSSCNIQPQYEGIRLVCVQKIEKFPKSAVGALGSSWCGKSLA